MDISVPRVGRLFAQQTIGVGAVNEIVAPTSNPGGLIIRTLQLYSFPTTSGSAGVALYADLAAPADANDLTRRIVLDASGQASATAFGYAQLPFPLFIDPGFGLWFAATAGSGTGGTLLMTYDLLGLGVNG